MTPQIPQNVPFPTLTHNHNQIVLTLVIFCCDFNLTLMEMDFNLSVFSSHLTELFILCALRTLTIIPHLKSAAAAATARPRFLFRGRATGFELTNFFAIPQHGPFPRCCTPNLANPNTLSWFQTRYGISSALPYWSYPHGVELKNFHDFYFYSYALTPECIMDPNGNSYDFLSNVHFEIISLARTLAPARREKQCDNVPLTRSCTIRIRAHNAPLS